MKLSATPRSAARAAVALLGALTVSALALTPAFAAPGTPALAEDYPTWAEVEAARSSEEATAATYDRLRAALTSALQESEAAASVAQQAYAESQRAEQALNDANEREQQIKSELETAQNALSANSDAFARTVSWMYRDGTGLARYSDLSTAENAEEFMAKLSTAEQIAGTWGTLTARATEAVNTVNGLEDQAAVVTDRRQTLLAEAKVAAEKAERALNDAERAVALAQQRTDTIYEQLAVLRGTTAEIERQYELGLQVSEQEPQGPGSDSGDDGGGGGGDGGSVPPPSGSIMTPAEAQAYARSAIGAYGWGSDQFSCLVSLWNGESNWRVTAENPWSGAYGIPQSLPASKMAAAGPDWRTNGVTQVNWGLAYISSVYGSPCAAWNRWLARDPHWY